MLTCVEKAYCMSPKLTVPFRNCLVSNDAEPFLSAVHIGADILGCFLTLEERGNFNFQRSNLAHQNYTLIKNFVSW